MNLGRARERLLRDGAGRLLLAVLSMLYGVVVWARRTLYDAGLLRRVRLPAKVLCFGNLTAGGAGKTPAVLLAAEALLKRGRRVAVLSRGYGRRAGSPVVALEDGGSAHWTEVGDEPWMLHQALAGKGVPIVVAPDRARGGRWAVEERRTQVLLLDDGFQHFRLERDADILLVNALDPFGGGRLLPWGLLREPVSAARRASLAVITHSNLVDGRALASIREALRAASPDLPVALAEHRADYLLDPRSGARRPPPSLKGRDVVSLAGLAHPHGFERALEALGAKIVQRWRFPDHHAYAPEDLQAVERARRGLSPASPPPVITTFKDLPRLPWGWETSLSGDILLLCVRLQITEGQEAWEAALARGL